jgi:hypothetical protein
VLLQVDRVVSLTLGSNWRQAGNTKFDRELAESSLAFYASSDIPTISTAVPATVSGIHFTSNLTDVVPADLRRWRAMPGLFEAALAQ